MLYEDAEEHKGPGYLLLGLTEEASVSMLTIDLKVNIEYN